MDFWAPEALDKVLKFHNRAGRVGSGNVEEGPSFGVGDVDKVPHFASLMSFARAVCSPTVESSAVVIGRPAYSSCSWSIFRRKPDPGLA